jgi:hypothetical protein
VLDSTMEQQKREQQTMKQVVVTKICRWESSSVAATTDPGLKKGLERAMATMSAMPQAGIEKERSPLQSLSPQAILQKTRLEAHLKKD